MTKTLLIISGKSGSGKSTLAATLQELTNCIVCTADDFFMVDGKYEFDPQKLGQAHDQCQIKCFAAMAKKEPLVVVANTTTTQKQASPYIQAAKLYEYRVHWVFLGKTHNNKNVHGVPDFVLDSQGQKLIQTFKMLTE